MTDTNQLPPLPEPEGFADPSCGGFMCYTTDQMREYALQALAQVQTQVRMTDEQVDAFTINGRLHWLGKRQLIRAVETYYGIPARIEKEMHNVR